MQAEVHADCPRCFESVSSQRPNCGACGLWMPWGDARIEQLREERRAEFAARELREEAEWAEARAHGQASAPAPGLATKARSLGHRAGLSPRANWAVGAACGAVLGAVATLGLQVLVPSASKRPTGVCSDGNATFARGRSGACAGHGGLREFYK